MDFIDGYVSDALPLAPSVTPKQGVSQTSAREDHVHPTTVAETALADYATTDDLNTALEDYTPTAGNNAIYASKAEIAPLVTAKMFTIAVANWAADGGIFKFTHEVHAKPAGAQLIAVVFPNTTLDNIQSAGIVIKSWDAGGLVLNRPTACTEALVGHLLYL